MQHVRRRGLAVMTTIVMAAAVGMGNAGVAYADPDDPAPVLDFRVVDVDPADFVVEAAELPEDLAWAVRRDLDISPAEYLARAEAAVAGVDAVDAISSAGVEVLGAELDGLALVVYVPDASAAELVATTGARAIIGEPPPFEQGDLEFEFMDDVRGGQPYFYEDEVPDTFFRCSIAFGGYDVPSGEQRAITAGHCLGNAAAPRYTMTATRPNVFPDVPGVLFGSAVAGSYRFGDGYDHGLMDPVPGRNLVPEVLRWGNGALAPLANAPLIVRDAVEPIVGSPLCRSGATTGWRCGEIEFVDATAIVDGRDVRGIIANVCLRPGDSGGAALVGSSAVGINSAGNPDATCSTSADKSLFTQLYSDSAESADELYGGGWEPMVGVAAPVVTSPGVNGIHRGSTLHGTLPFGGPRHRVEIVIDGSITRTATVSSNGTWSIPISDLPDGAHEFTATARWGTHSISSAVSGGWIDTIPTRLEGVTRYETALAIARVAFPGTAPVVFIASGAGYADALSAGPAAAELGGPLLLTPPTSLPAAIRSELERLRPAQIIIVGGSGAVSESVASDLRQYATHPSSPVVRLGGDTRYETSRLVAAFAFGDSAVTLALIATGRDFPDALSAGAAGAVLGGPVVLIDGAQTSADLATRNLLGSLGIDRIVIAGGPAVVSTGVQTSLASVAPVTRLSGIDRYATAIAINAYAFDDADAAYIAYSHNFPDALAGSVLAGVNASPMFLASGTCVPAGMVDHMIELGVDRVTLFGGESVLGATVANLRRC